MAFASNPLSLSIPDSTFDSWLRDSGYLEVLDNAATTTTTKNSNPATDASPAEGGAAITPTTTVTQGILHYMRIVISLLFTVNPFAKLTTGDFAGGTPSWTREFFGFYDSYSVPSSTDTLKLRVHENVKRYAKNYGSLLILFFACSLYQMPLALAGLLSILALWDLFKYCCSRLQLDRHSDFHRILTFIAASAVMAILMLMNVLVALACAVGVSYIVMIMHAAFRKLRSTKPPSRGRGGR